MLIDKETVSYLLSGVHRGAGSGAVCVCVCVGGGGGDGVREGRRNVRTLVLFFFFQPAYPATRPSSFPAKFEGNMQNWCRFEH